MTPINILQIGEKGDLCNRKYLLSANSNLLQQAKNVLFFWACCYTLIIFVHQSQYLEIGMLAVFVLSLKKLEGILLWKFKQYSFLEV